MKVSKLFGKSLRENPSDVELVSHGLMLRSAMICQASSGVYTYMPLAWRSIRKIEQIIREEINAVGGQELRLPALQPREIWQQSGRYDTMGEDMFRLDDRRQRHFVLAPTHEEILTNVVGANVHSYRDLPLILYQIQTKFRDEQRPRGGLIRVREFDMKDAYSFDTDNEGLDLSYKLMVEAYKNIFDRCGLSTVLVDADSGAIGGRDSQEFVLLAEAGEDTIVLCENCGYAANTEKAEFAKLEQDTEIPVSLEDVHTPAVKTVKELANFLGISARRVIKTLVYIADGKMVIVLIRGDLDVNETKLRNLLHVSNLRFATKPEVESVGMVSGFAAPVGTIGVEIIADDSIQSGINFVTGANKKDYHLLNVNYPRDFDAGTIADIALANDRHPCITCSSELVVRRGIEVGHVFKLGTRYSETLGTVFSDASGLQRPIIMGCYGIGVGRLLAAVIEQNHDEGGIIFPVTIAPYQVWLTALNVKDESVVRVADSIYKELVQENIEVLYDDREEAAGVKFNDADLLGLPVRLVVSQRNLKEGVVELKKRSDSCAYKLKTDTAAENVRKMLAEIGLKNGK